MKYVLLFCGSDEDAVAFNAMTPEELRARYKQVGAWFAEHRTRIGATNQLQGPETATSVRFGPGGPPVVTDGPYIEGKESIGGYAEHRAIALSHVLGPQAALDEVQSLAADLDRYHLGHATRAELLRQLGRPDLARHADERALSLTANPAERALLEQRLAREAPRCRLAADRPPLKTAKGSTPMATTEEGLQAQIRNIEATYGKTMSEWHAIVAASGITKHTDVVSMLKSDYGMTHGAAHRVSLVARERADPAVGSAPDADPASALYAGKKAALRPLHDALINVVMAFGDDIGLAPKKGYLSLRRRKQFAMIQPSGAGRIDVGLILPDLPAGQRLEPATGFNALFTHRVRLSSASDIDTELTGWLRQAYDRAR